MILAKETIKTEVASLLRELITQLEESTSLEFRVCIDPESGALYYFVGDVGYDTVHFPICVAGCVSYDMCYGNLELLIEELASDITSELESELLLYESSLSSLQATGSKSGF